VTGREALAVDKADASAVAGGDDVHAQVEVARGIVDAQHAVANLIGDLVQAASLI